MVQSGPCSGIEIGAANTVDQVAHLIGYGKLSSLKRLLINLGLDPFPVRFGVELP